MIVRISSKAIFYNAMETKFIVPSWKKENENMDRLAIRNNCIRKDSNKSMNELRYLIVDWLFSKSFLMRAEENEFMILLSDEKEEMCVKSLICVSHEKFRNNWKKYIRIWFLFSIHFLTKLQSLNPKCYFEFIIRIG